MHKFTCARCQKAKTCTIQGCLRDCEKVCGTCLYARGVGFSQNVRRIGRYRRRTRTLTSGALDSTFTTPL